MFNDLVKALAAEKPTSFSFSISQDGKANLALTLDDGCKMDETVLVEGNPENQVNYLVKRALLFIQNHQG